MKRDILELYQNIQFEIVILTHINLKQQNHYTKFLFQILFK